MKNILKGTVTVKQLIKRLNECLPSDEVCIASNMPDCLNTHLRILTDGETYAIADI